LLFKNVFDEKFGELVAVGIADDEDESSSFMIVQIVFD